MNTEKKVNIRVFSAFFWFTRLVILIFKQAYSEKKKLILQNYNIIFVHWKKDIILRDVKWNDTMPLEIYF